MITGNQSSEQLEEHELVSPEAIQNLAAIVRGRGLSSIVIFFIEMYRPIAGILLNLTFLSYPLLMVLFGKDGYSQALQIMQSDKTMNDFINCLQEDKIQNGKGLKV